MAITKIGMDDVEIIKNGLVFEVHLGGNYHPMNQEEFINLIKFFNEAKRIFDIEPKIPVTTARDPHDLQRLVPTFPYKFDNTI